MSRISLAPARTIIDAAFARRAELKLKPLSMAALDTAGLTAQG